MKSLLNALKPKATITIASFLTIFVTSSLALAQHGTASGGGGDACELRIKEVRDDISTWLKKGGAQSLARFSANQNAADYTAKMLNAITSTRISCVSEGDRGFPVQVNGKPKQCRWESTNAGSYITCDTAKFLNKGMDEDRQYELINHEYASIAGYEIPNEDDSDYRFSNQLSVFLESRMVKRLVVKPAPLVPAPVDVRAYMLPSNSMEFGYTIGTFIGRDFCESIPENCHIPTSEDVRKELALFRAEAPRRTAVIMASSQVYESTAIQLLNLARGSNSKKFRAMYEFAAARLQQVARSGSKASDASTEFKPGNRTEARLLQLLSLTEKYEKSLAFAISAGADEETILGVKTVHMKKVREGVGQVTYSPAWCFSPKESGKCNPLVDRYFGPNARAELLFYMPSDKLYSQGFDIRSFVNVNGSSLEEMFGDVRIDVKEKDIYGLNLDLFKDADIFAKILRDDVPFRAVHVFAKEDSYDPVKNIYSVGRSHHSDGMQHTSSLLRPSEFRATMRK